MRTPGGAIRFHAHARGRQKSHAHTWLPIRGSCGTAVGAMVPNGWSGDYQNQNALSHVMVQDYIAKYGGTASQINADVA